MPLKTNVHRRSRRKTSGANFPPIAVRALAAGESSTNQIDVTFDRPVNCDASLIPAGVICGARHGTAQVRVDDDVTKVTFTFSGSIAGVGVMSIPDALPGVTSKWGPGQVQGVTALVVTD